jgi:hypothetical protein
VEEVPKSLERVRILLLLRFSEGANQGLPDFVRIGIESILNEQALGSFNKPWKIRI